LAYFLEATIDALEIEIDRLFAEYRFAGVRSLDGKIGVRIGGRRYQHRIDLRVRKCALDIGSGRTVPIRERRGRRFIDLDHVEQARAVECGKVSRMYTADAAGTKLRKAQDRRTPCFFLYPLTHLFLTSSVRLLSFQLDAGILDHFAPLHDFALDERAQLFRRA